MENNPHPHPHPRPHLYHQPHDFLNVSSENYISKGFHESSSSSSSSPPNLAVCTELSLSSSFFTKTKTKTKRNTNNKERSKAASSSKPCYSDTKTYHRHHREGNIITQPSSSSHGRCSTALKLYDDPWKIKKVLTTSDLGKLNRLLLSTENFMEDLVASLMGNNNHNHDHNNNKNNNNDDDDEELVSKGRPVRVWDVETTSMHQLILKQWASIKNYVLIGNWNQDFVKRRNLKKGDEIGLQWDPYKFYFNFSVLKRSSAME
ncbi:hypothetical protein K1719_006360 [Acacia pycnantha]|nr:hypothetical protein K1719_006360 [Acacia pycnantha]